MQISGYLNMVNDVWRNQFYHDALKKHSADRVVLDVGTGTGILAFYALKFGAKFVYCIEQKPYMAKIADSVLSSNFDRSRFKVITANFWTNKICSEINHPIEILVTETVGPGLFDQGMFHTWSSALPMLTPNAICIPDRLHSDVWIWDRCTSVQKNYFTNLTKSVGGTFTPDCTLDSDFSAALIDVGNRINNLQPHTQWVELNKVQVQPTSTIDNVLDYSKDRMPPLTFSESDHPKHVIPTVEFDISIDRESQMAIVNKMSFEDQTLFLKDAKYMPWKYAPTFSLTGPGIYRLTYNNYDLAHMPSNEWQCQLISAQ